MTASKKVEVITQVQNGKFIRNRPTIKRIVESFEGEEVLITIQKVKKQRSNNQNSYYFGVIIPLIKDGLFDLTGEVFSANEAHDFLKSKFNVRSMVNEKTGEILELPKSTTENTTIEQEEYHERIRQFALEWMNIVIPLPHEDLKLEL